MDNLDKEARGIQLLLTIADVGQEAFVEAGIDPELARQAGLKAADRVRKMFGGEQPYIPKGLQLEIEERDWQVWKDYNGSNVLDLSKKYQRTPRQIYNIIARCRVEHDRKTQLPLFE